MCGYVGVVVCVYLLDRAHQNRNRCQRAGQDHSVMEYGAPYPVGSDRYHGRRYCQRSVLGKRCTDVSVVVLCLTYGRLGCSLFI